jgi:hypothetical protein
MNHNCNDLTPEEYFKKMSNMSKCPLKGAGLVTFSAIMASAIEGGPPGLAAGESQKPSLHTKAMLYSLRTFLGYSEFRNRSAGQITVVPDTKFGEKQALLACADKLVVDSQISNFQIFPNFLWAGPVWARKMPTSGE